MKFAFIADIHLSLYGQDKREEKSHLPERLHSIRAALHEVADYCVENNIRVMVIGGDILHGKSVIYAIAQEIMLQFFKDYNDFIKFYVIDGNHDLSGKGASVVSALRPLEDVHGVEWIDHTVSERSYNDIMFIPYSHQVAENVKKNKSKVLISHFGLSEGVLNSGMSIMQNISMNDLVGKYELVLLGHYHKPQEIITDDIKLYYVGSPIQLDWGEKGEDKRFLVVDTDTLDVQSIPTVGYRKHVELEVNSKNKEEVFKLAEAAHSAGDYVKIVKTETVDIESDQFIIIDKSEKDITNRGVTSSMSDKDKLQRFIDIKEIPSDKQGPYLNKGLDIINSCEGE